MKYQLSSRRGEVRPKAAFVLTSLGDQPLYFARHGSRHPLGVYNLTFWEIVRHMKAVLDELDRAAEEVSYASTRKYDWHQPLLNATDHLLDAIMQHLDSMQTIVEAFFEERNADEAVRVKKEIKKEINPYRDRVGRIVNAVKHNQAKLGSFYFHDVGLFVPGYFVEGICKDGAIGPDPNIHPSSNTAISFNRDLPYHIIQLYFVSSVVGGHLQKLLRAPAVPMVSETTDNDRELGEVLRRVAILSRTFFPDEVAMSMPLVEYRGDILDGGFTVNLEFPAQRAKPRSVPRGAHARASWTGDGASRKFKVPYWGGN